MPLSHDGNSKFNKLCAVGKHNWNHTLKCQTHQSPAFLEVDLKTFPINIHPQWNFQTKKRAFKEGKFIAFAQQRNVQIFIYFYGNKRINYLLKYILNIKNFSAISSSNPVLIEPKWALLYSRISLADQRLIMNLAV